MTLAYSTAMMMFVLNGVAKLPTIMAKKTSNLMVMLCVHVNIMERLPLMLDSADW